MQDFWKYHGLGNDYLVMEPARFAAPPGEAAVRLICDRHRGIGADGILLGPQAGEGPPAVRIFNPDGSESGKSGNGLRIFARHLWERGLVAEKRFPILTSAGATGAEVLDGAGERIGLEMGPVSFHSRDIPVTGEPREVLRETLQAAGRTWEVSCATVGNPHCVVFVEEPSEALAREVGPALETHPWFPERTNVQFAAPTGGHSLAIQIWERGAGYTQSSGTSSCAAAAVAVRLGLCASPVTVNTPGGALVVRLDPGFAAYLEGPVAAVGGGNFAPGFLAALDLERRGGEPGGGTP